MKIQTMQSQVIKMAGQELVMALSVHGVGSLADRFIDYFAGKIARHMIEIESKKENLENGA